MEIKNILICGLGGLGTLCGSKIKDKGNYQLKVLTDKSRYEKYKNITTYFNEKAYKFEIITEEEKKYKADLIIIATKSNGLSYAIKGIKNFIHKDSIIISILNGITSEEEIAKEYGYEQLLISFYIGHSCIRNGRKVEQDGIYKFKIGEIKGCKKENLARLAKFFNEVEIEYEISENIEQEYWKKFMINIGLNQLSAAYGLKLTEIKKEPNLIEELKGLMNEVKEIAKKEGISNTEKIYKEAENFVLKEMKEAHTSMLQDIEAKRKTEVDIFGKKVIELGIKHGIKTPFNNKIYKKIKEIEKENKRY